MSDETTPDTTAELELPAGEWAMPAPVFRTSEGHTPKSLQPIFEGDEHETEITNIEEVDPFEITPVNTPLDVAGAGPDEPASVPTVDSDKPIPAVSIDQIALENKIRPLPPPKKKGGCAKSFAVIAGVIGLAVLAVVAAAVYFIYYAKPADGGF